MTRAIAASGGASGRASGICTSALGCSRSGAMVKPHLITRSSLFVDPRAKSIETVGNRQQTHLAKTLSTFYFPLSTLYSFLPTSPFREPVDLSIRTYYQ